MIDMHVRTSMDRIFRDNPHFSGVTFAGEPHLSLGGVGRNLARALQMLGHAPAFITSLANDALGSFARSQMLAQERWRLLESNRLDGGQNNVASLEVLPASSASSCFALVLIDSISGQCEYVVANLEASRAISLQKLDVSLQRLLGPAKLLVLDANLSAGTLSGLLDKAKAQQVAVFIEPTDVNCLKQLVEGLSGAPHAPIAVMSPNVIELAHMLKLFGADSRQLGIAEPSAKYELGQIKLMASRLLVNYLPQLRCLLVTMDKRGLLVAVKTSAKAPEELDQLDAAQLMAPNDINSCAKGDELILFKHYPPQQLIERPISASGAGDCFASGFISGLLDNLTLVNCVKRGMKASLVALSSKDTVPVELKRMIRAGSEINSELDK